MEGHEVNSLRENQATLDDDKSKAFISAKLHVFNVAFHNFESSFLKALGEDDPKYGFIPFPSGPFVEMLIESSLHFQMDRTKKFLDVGSGPGTKLLLANVLFSAHGLELNPNFVRMANQMGIQNVFQGDALEYENYDEYDVLYFYRPFKDEEMQFQLESRVTSQMKPGALVAPMHTSDRWPELEMKQLTKYLYVKQ